MNFHPRSLLVFALCLTPAAAESPGIDQSLELVFNQNNKPFILWHGKPGRSYFIQISDPADHLKTWYYHPGYEFGTGIDLYCELVGTPDKNFLRLLYLDDPAVTSLKDVEFACFDGQGMPAEWKVMNGLDPFDGSGVNGPDGDLDGASDIRGITTSQGLANRLTLLDNAGNLRQGPFGVIEFSTPASGVASPVFRSNPGFIQGGLTGGGAREFVLPNLPVNQLQNVNTRIIP